MARGVGGLAQATSPYVRERGRVRSSGRSSPTWRVPITLGDNIGLRQMFAAATWWRDRKPSTARAVRDSGHLARCAAPSQRRRPVPARRPFPARSRSPTRHRDLPRGTRRQRPLERVIIGRYRTGFPAPLLHFGFRTASARARRGGGSPCASRRNHRHP